MEKVDRSIRLLKMFDMLQRGAGLSSRELQNKFGITAKSVQRDIDELRTYISENYDQAHVENIEYSRVQKSYIWRGRSHILLNEKEILLIAIILLESRGLTKEELNRILEKMFLQCTPEAEAKIKQLIKNEMFYYKATQNSKPMGELLWVLMDAKQRQKCLRATYKRIRNSEYEPVELMPLGIMFSEMYFYLLAKVVGDLENEVITFRVDRLGECEVLDRSFRVEYNDRFQEGIFRQEIQFMSMGKLMNVVFRYSGKSLEAVLDRLANAEVLSKDEHGTVIRAKVYEQGAKMWFMTQAENLEILEPECFRKSMQESIEKMLSLYVKQEDREGNAEDFS